MRPVEGERRHLEQSNEVAGRRWIHDDALIPFLSQRVSEPDEGVQLIDPGRREREQLTGDRAIVRRIETGAHECLERTVDSRFVLTAPPSECGTRIDLARDEAIAVGHLTVFVPDGMVQRVGDGRRGIGGDEKGAVSGASHCERAGCTRPFSSVVRLMRVAGWPSHIHGRRKRVSAFGCTGPVRAASAHVLPPSAETSTRRTRPVPDHARPEIS